METFKNCTILHFLTVGIDRWWMDGWMDAGYGGMEAGGMDGWMDGWIRGTEE